MRSAPAGYERYPGAAARPLSPSYRRREPEKTALYDIVSRDLESCLEQAEEKSEHGYGYPRFVEREFKKFLGCGLLRRGCVRVKCGNCLNEKLVAFSCKSRTICPSCTARRMANTAAHLVDRVLPDVAYRQWVISFPRRVRFLLARDHDLLSDVLSASLRKIFAWHPPMRPVRRRNENHRGYLAYRTYAPAWYPRVSSRAQNHATQLAAIEQAASARGDTIAVWYSEKRSGKELARPELDRLRGDARAGRLRRVYLFKLDRLTRSGIRDTPQVVGGWGTMERKTALREAVRLPAADGAPGTPVVIFCRAPPASAPPRHLVDAKA